MSTPDTLTPVSSIDEAEIIPGLTGFEKEIRTKISMKESIDPELVKLAPTLRAGLRKINNAPDPIRAARDWIKQQQIKKHNDEKNRPKTYEDCENWLIINQSMELIKQRDAATTPEERSAAEKAISEFREQHGYVKV